MRLKKPQSLKSPRKITRPSFNSSAFLLGKISILLTFAKMHYKDINIQYKYIYYIVSDILMKISKMQYEFEFARLTESGYSVLGSLFKSREYISENMNKMETQTKK